ncbi:hypothetical protein LCGC14_0980870 [marine sediment metagenome]|uniref:Transketolase-like pyrimidine-binding domain-containing protein n=1 Tax=marine sediment metagenome TaxID=412755 RepID=A0A0F9ND84_9ZZZZ
MVISGKRGKIQMTYRDKIVEELALLGRKKKAVFLGEGINTGDRIYGTMNRVKAHKCVEMPVAENLIAGCAVGLAMKGLKPIVVFQRMDFMLIAADQIINHAALIGEMSGGQFPMPIIFRTIVGSQSDKFEVGPQHKHDFTHIFEPYIMTVRYAPSLHLYRGAYESVAPTLIVERKDDYELEAD